MIWQSNRRRSADEITAGMGLANSAQRRTARCPGFTGILGTTADDSWTGQLQRVIPRSRPKRRLASSRSLSVLLGHQLVRPCSITDLRRDQALTHGARSGDLHPVPLIAVAFPPPVNCHRKASYTTRGALANT